MDAISRVTHGKKEDGNTKIVNRGKTTTSTCYSKQVMVLESYFLIQKKLIFSLIFTQFQIVSAGKSFPAEKMMIFFLKSLATCFLLMKKALQKHRKKLIHTKLPNLEAEKRSFRKLR